MVDYKLNSESKFAQELGRKIWITGGSRFNAHQRLLCQHNWSIAAIAFLSAYVIVFTLLRYIPTVSITANQMDIISFSAIALSLFILVISLLEASKSYQKKATEFHNCGRELSALYNKLLYTLDNPGVDVSKIFEIAEEYQAILNKCPENHDVVDYNVFRSQHRHEFNLGILDMVRFTFMFLIKSYLIYLLLIIIPLIGIIILLMV